MNCEVIKRVCACLVIGSAACAGHPQEVGVYTPLPRAQVYSNVERKAVELGYTVRRPDPEAFELVAERVLDPSSNGAGADREELHIEIAPDASGVTRIRITAARVIPATADHPIRRVASSARGSADANAILRMFMKVR